MEQLEADCDWVDMLLDSNFKQLYTVHDALISVLYTNVSPQAAIEDFMSKNSPKTSKKRGENRGSATMRLSLDSLTVTV